MSAKLDDQLPLLSDYERSTEETDIKTVVNIRSEECQNNGNQLEEIVIDSGSTEQQEPYGDMPVPELTGDETYHLFIASASADRDSVLPIVEELEKSFRVRCLFHERDFSAGTGILHNIRKGLSTSMKTVFFFTPNFTASRHCLLELEIAINNTMETWSNRIIPVLYQDCEIPDFLKPRTFINATLPGMTPTKLASQIKKSLSQREPPEKCIPVKFTSKHSKYKNGTSVDITATVQQRCLCRPSTFEFRLTHTTLRLLKDRDINATPRVLRKTITLLNNDPVMKKYGQKRRLCSLGCRYFCGLCPLSFFICLAFYLLLMFCITSRQPSERSAQLMATSQWVTYVPIAVAVVGVLGVVTVNHFRMAMDVKNLKDKLWKEITSTTYKGGLAFSFQLCSTGPPQLKIFKYDITKCKEHLLTLLESRRCNRREESRPDFEDEANGIVRNCLKYMCNVGPDYWGLPEANENRHNVIKDRMCLCQLYEDINPPE